MNNTFTLPPFTVSQENRDWAKQIKDQVLEARKDLTEVEKLVENLRAKFAELDEEISAASPGLDLTNDKAFAALELKKSQHAALDKQIFNIESKLPKMRENFATNVSLWPRGLIRATHADFYWTLVAKMGEQMQQFFGPDNISQEVARQKAREMPVARSLQNYIAHHQWGNDTIAAMDKLIAGECPWHFEGVPASQESADATA